MGEGERGRRNYIKIIKMKEKSLENVPVVCRGNARKGMLCLKAVSRKRYLEHSREIISNRNDFTPVIFFDSLTDRIDSFVLTSFAVLFTYQTLKNLPITA